MEKNGGERAIYLWVQVPTAPTNGFTPDSNKDMICNMEVTSGGLAVQSVAQCLAKQNSVLFVGWRPGITVGEKS